MSGRDPVACGTPESCSAKPVWYNRAYCVAGDTVGGEAEGGDGAFDGMDSESEDIDRVSGSPFRTTNGRGGGAYDSDPDESVRGLGTGRYVRDVLWSIPGG